jgi:hypothetical protein
MTPRSHALFFRPPPSITASFDARRYTAATLRLSLRAITVVFVFSRASVFSIRTSSFVHGRIRVIFFAIVAPHVEVLPSNQRPSQLKTPAQLSGMYFSAPAHRGRASGSVGITTGLTAPLVQFLLKFHESGVALVQLLLNVRGLSVKNRKRERTEN